MARIPETVSKIDVCASWISYIVWCPNAIWQNPQLILACRCPHKCMLRRMICWQQFYRFWAQCRFVSTFQWIMTLNFMCLWFWRLRSFRHDTSGHMSVFSNSSTESDIQLFLITHPLSICVESSIDSDIWYHFVSTVLQILIMGGVRS